MPICHNGRIQPAVWKMGKMICRGITPNISPRTTLPQNVISRCDANAPKHSTHPKHAPLARGRLIHKVATVKSHTTENGVLCSHCLLFTLPPMRSMHIYRRPSGAIGNFAHVLRGGCGVAPASARCAIANARVFSGARASHRFRCEGLCGVPRLPSEQRSSPERIRCPALMLPRESRTLSFNISSQLHRYQEVQGKRSHHRSTRPLAASCN